MNAYTSDSISVLRELDTSRMFVEFEKVLLPLNLNQKIGVLLTLQKSELNAFQHGILVHNGKLLCFDSDLKFNGTVVVSTITVDNSTTLSRYHAALKFSSIYHSYNAPSIWSVQTYAHKYEYYASKVQIYADADASIDAVRRIASEREPARVGMQKKYSSVRLQEHFGYSQSGYFSHYEQTGNLAPNIAIRTCTPVKFRGNVLDIHVLHAIGAALDAKSQPDYKVLNSSAKLYTFYVNVFKKIFRCANDLKRGSIVLSKLGAFVLEKPWFQHHVWIPAFEHVRQDNLHMRLYMMNFKMSAVKTFLLKTGVIDLGTFSNCVLRQPKALFVNTWDCHSVVGNSFGQVSAVHFFTHGMFNPLMFENIVFV